MNITAGIYKGRKIYTPDESIVRPTLSKIRMSVFNTLYSIMGDFEGKSFLDVFGGSGIMGLEAVSRGFKDIYVFEKDIKTSKIIQKNYLLLGLNPKLYVGDSGQLVKKVDKIFDVAYIDPPYESGIYENIIEQVKSRIIVTESNFEIKFDGMEVIKEKKYGDKYVSFVLKH